jgi:CBS domain-containing protein
MTAHSRGATVLDTAAIGHRVVDFLKKHAPFSAIDDADLLALAGGGRVRFYEPNEYILWQGEPHRSHVFVVQQGTVSLWEDEAGEPALRDVRGAGDLLGVERYYDAPACLYTVRSETEVVVYGFSATDFDACVLSYPHAARYVAAESRVTPEFRATDVQRDSPRAFLQTLVGRRELPRCTSSERLDEAARRLHASRADALVVTDAGNRVEGLITAGTLLEWIARGGGDAGAPVSTLVRAPVPVSPDATIADGILAMAAADADAVAITRDGSSGEPVQALVTRGDLVSAFGDHPLALLDEARAAPTIDGLRQVNQRTRAFVLAQLDGASSVDWLTRLTGLVDGVILGRVAGLAGFDGEAAAIGVGGSAGRTESLTLRAPILVAVHDDGVPGAAVRSQLQAVHDGLIACGYLPRVAHAFDADFAVASVGAWTDRYRAWIDDPVLQQAYRFRAFFDVRAVHGRRSLWQEVDATATGSVKPDFLYLMANDCMDSLPPLTFFEDAVVDSFGEHAETFRLEHSALAPLVDVGRVFALAARDVFGRSTLERLTHARVRLPEQDEIFREAADTLRIVLWQQGRVGITEGTAGTELPAALLGSHDRRSLKSGFRSIRRLLEFTADLAWLKRL